MSEPKGEVIARPMVTRACGCQQEFQHYSKDKFRAQRQAKFEQTRCTACVAKLVEEQRAAAAALPTKGEAMGLLPIGTKVTMTLRPDGKWDGTLAAGGTTVQGDGEGMRGLVVLLARLWVTAAGVGKPPAKPAKPAAG